MGQRMGKLPRSDLRKGSVIDHTLGSSDEDGFRKDVETSSNQARPHALSLAHLWNYQHMQSYAMIVFINVALGPAFAR